MMGTSEVSLKVQELLKQRNQCLDNIQSLYRRIRYLEEEAGALVCPYEFGDILEDWQGAQYLFLRSGRLAYINNSCTMHVSRLARNGNVDDKVHILLNTKDIAKVGEHPVKAAEALKRAEAQKAKEAQKEAQRAKRKAERARKRAEKDRKKAVESK